MANYYSAFDFHAGKTYLISGCSSKEEVHDFCRKNEIATIYDAIHELTEEDYLERKKYKDMVDKGSIKHKTS